MAMGLGFVPGLNRGFRIIYSSIRLPMTVSVRAS